ncbi:MAG: hypothetical protein MRY64_10925 [Hyphomonadaceae bacterium]|nr:hypothetical protein [Hyphomonadaceae bacterium]
MSFLQRLLRKPDPIRTQARDLADSIMAAARRPALFVHGFAKDDFDGRFEMVALHGALIMRRLKTLGQPGLVVSEKLGEVLFDRFDYAYREEGVGDASIARKVRKLGERYYGLARALDVALEGQGASVAEVLSRNGLGGDDLQKLAAWVIETDRQHALLSDEDLLQARLDWPQISRV